MTATGDFLNQVVPTIVRLARRPGFLLLRAAAVSIGVLALLGIVRALTGTGWVASVPLVLAGLLTAPALVLAVRRERLQAQAQGLHQGQTIESAPQWNDGPLSRPGSQDDADTLTAAMVENSIRTARFFPRLEAAQRAGLLAAGGPINAPYLRDDLRVTLVALFGTIAAVPLATLGAIVTAAVLLSTT